MRDLNLGYFLNTILGFYAPTCFSKDCRNTNIDNSARSTDLFFCINTLKGPRSDANVTEYRNFLVEIDDLPLEQQIEYVTSKIPVTSIVYSGGKSYHFIISLEAQVQTEGEYKDIADRLLELLPNADKSCRNPSRFSRLPYRIRPETQKWQTLVALNSRIENEVFLSLLPPPRFVPPKSTQKPSKQFISVTLNYAMELPDQFMLERGFSGRNHFFFYLYNRLKDEGLGQSEIREYIEYTYGNLKNRTGFELKEALSAARLY